MSNHVFVALDEEISKLVPRVLEACPYMKLKEQLIKHLSVSETAKLNHLQTKLMLGGAVRQLLHEMKQLCCDKASTDLLQPLWLQRLPGSTQTIVACADSGSLDTSNQVVQWQQAVEALTATVSKLAEAIGALRSGSSTRSHLDSSSERAIGK